MNGEAVCMDGSGSVLINNGLFLVKGFSNALTQFRLFGIYILPGFPRSRE
jgi:hypothetical protein